MFGLAPVRGRLALKGGVITLGDSPAHSSVDATIDATSFSTRNPLRDVQVRSRLFLHTKRHPIFSFQSDSVSSGNGTRQIRGTLTVRGKSAPVELTVDQIHSNGSGLTVKAHGEIDRYALGVTALKGMAARRLTFELDASAVPE